MKRRTLCGSGWIVGCVAILLAVVQQSAAQEAATQESPAAAPKAMPLEPVKDFGIIPKGRKIGHEFEIRNDGTSLLEISAVHPACGCTVVKYDETIVPGAVGKIRAVVDTANLHGPISKTISVMTNDPAQPKVQLAFRAQVKPYIGVFPGYARYSYVQREKIQPIPQTLWADDGKPFKVLGVEAPYDHLKVGFRRAKEEERRADVNGDQWVVDILLDTEAPVGALRDYVLVKTDHPEQKEARIPVSGFVRPRQHVTPDKINFGELSSETLPYKRSLSFVNFITDGIEVTKAESDLEGISVEVVEVGKKDGHRFKLLLTLKEDIPKGPFKSTIRLHITDQDNPVVEVPVSGSVI